MQIVIDGTDKEIAALVLAIQERQEIKIKGKEVAFAASKKLHTKACTAPRKEECHLAVGTVTEKSSFQKSVY